jgi:hypothetical protein
MVQNHNADVAQLVEHVLGKDEVTGSIPVISSVECGSRNADCGSRSHFGIVFHSAISIPTSAF